MAGLVARAGVDMGRRLIRPDRHNPLGYFEDQAVVDLHRGVFARGLPANAEGHLDWGWTVEEHAITTEARGHLTATARSLEAARRHQDRPWGFKDPRATLFLDVWDTLLPDARYVLVYRRPWLVADSMQRLGADVFLRHPTWGYRIWQYYNRRLLDFFLRHRDRAVLIAADALPGALDDVATTLERRLDLAVPIDQLRAGFAPDLLRRAPAADPMDRLFEAGLPSFYALFRDLNEAADLPAPTARPRLQVPGWTTKVVGTPEVSVITATRNDAWMLLDALASLEAHSGDPLEVLIVNDGTDDAESLVTLAGLRALGYRILDQAHAGLAAARNRGIAAARGQYIFPLDADNRWAASFLAGALAVLRVQPQVGVVYGDRHLFGLASGRLTVAAPDVDRLLRNNYIDAAALFRREMWEQTGGYDERLPVCEDWEFWVHALSRGWQFTRLDEICVEYRVRPNSMSRQDGMAALWAQARAHVRRKHRSWITTRQRQAAADRYQRWGMRLRRALPHWLTRDEPA